MITKVIPTQLHSYQPSQFCSVYDDVRHHKTVFGLQFEKFDDDNKSSVSDYFRHWWLDFSSLLYLLCVDLALMTRIRLTEMRNQRIYWYFGWPRQRFSVSNLARDFFWKK